MRIPRRTGFVLFVVLAVMFGLVGSVEAGRQCTWVVSILEGPSEDSAGTLANDISDTGYIGGAWFDEFAGWHAAYWYRGDAYDLEDEIGIPEGTVYSNVLSINNGGLMVGDAWSADYSKYVGALWDLRRETCTELTTDSDDLLAVYVYGVNAPGDVVGAVIEAVTVSPGFQFHAYIWPRNDRDGYKLPTTDDFLHTVCYGINARGAIAGLGVTWDGEVHALLWKKDAYGDYELIDLQEEEFDDSDLIMSQAYDVGEHGAVVGNGLWDADEPPVPFVWSRRGGVETLDTGDSDTGIAWKAVGNYIAGGIGTGGSLFGQNISDDGVVWRNGTLHVVATSHEGYDYFESSSVNRRGVVVGIALKEYDEDDPSTMIPGGFVARMR